SIRNIQSLKQGPRSSPAEFNSPHHHLRERKSSAPSHSSHPTLFTFETPSNHLHQTTLSTSAPQDYLFLHQCMSRKSENMRSASFSQASRSSFFMRSDSAVQKLVQGMFTEVSRLSTELRDSTYDLPRSFGSDTPTKSSLTGLESENEEVYSYKTPSNALFYQIPRTFTLDKNHNALALASNDFHSAPPPRPLNRTGREAMGSPQQQHNGDTGEGTASSCEAYDYPQFGEFSTQQSVESINDGFNSYLQTKSTLVRSESADSEDNYVPMNPGSSCNSNSDYGHSAYIPMSPGPHQFDLHGFSSNTLPSQKGSTASLCARPNRVSDQPPPVNRNLKPKCKSAILPSLQPSTSSVASDEKVDYVQVDKEKTQALQNTRQEWTDVRQSTEPAKSSKP
ncbi:hypothetical protein GDO86_018447, partial [Hymenochirus boettgeri]